MKRAYQYFWVVSVICAFLGCIYNVSGEDTVINVDVYDTYFVIAHTHFYFSLALLYFFVGLIYMLGRNLKLAPILIKIHTIITVGGFAVCFLLTAIASKFHDPSDIFDRTPEIANMGIAIISLLVIITQLLFIINIIIGLIKIKRQ